MKYKAFLRLRVDKISVDKWTKSPFIGGQNLRWVDKISVGWTRKKFVYSENKSRQIFRWVDSSFNSSTFNTAAVRRSGGKGFSPSSVRWRYRALLADSDIRKPRLPFTFYALFSWQITGVLPPDLEG